MGPKEIAAIFRRLAEQLESGVETYDLPEDDILALLDWIDENEFAEMV